MAWQRDFFEKWQFITPLAPSLLKLFFFFEGERKEQFPNEKMSQMAANWLPEEWSFWCKYSFSKWKNVQCTKCPLEDLRLLLPPITSYYPKVIASDGGYWAGKWYAQKGSQWERCPRPASPLARLGTSWNQGQLWGQQHDLIGFSLQSIEQTSINPQKTLSRRTLSLLRMWKLRGAAGSWKDSGGENRALGSEISSPERVKLQEMDEPTELGRQRRPPRSHRFWGRPRRLPFPRRLQRGTGWEPWLWLWVHQAGDRSSNDCTWAQIPLVGA